MLGGDEYDIVHALVCNRHIRNIKGLGIHRSINGLAKQLHEIVRVDVVRREEPFVGVQSGAGVVIVPGQDAYLRGERRRAG